MTNPGLDDNCSMTDRFYLPSGLGGGSVELSGSEAHHLLHVLRRKPGDEILLFDGRGTVATAEIADCSRRSARLRVTRRREFAPPRPPLLLGAAVPKGDRLRWLVEKSTELGVTRFVPLQTARSVVVPGSGKLDKMRNTVIAASKQCGRSHLMPVETPQPWGEFLERECNGATLLVAHASGEPVDRSINQADPDRPIVLAVGPEGGFTDDEIERAVRRGAQPVSLGPLTLRTETAALALAARFALQGESTTNG